MTEDITFDSKAEPEKRFSLSNYCLSCSDLIPVDKDFCCEGCRDNFYDDSALARDEDEELAEQRELEHEEKKEKAGLFEEGR